MCNSNDRLKEDGAGNGTQCRIVGIKLKEDQTSHRWKIWDNKKVWTVRASDVEYVEFEHHPKTRCITSLEEKLKRLKDKDETSNEAKACEQELRREKQSRRFRLKPKTVTCKVNVSPNDQVDAKRKMKCSITQIPVNSSDAITGHKLQGLTKDNIIVYSWNKSTNWIYVVLSRVRTLSGLYLVRRLRLSDIKPASRDYLAFLRRMRALEQREFERCGRSGNNA